MSNDDITFQLEDFHLVYPFLLKLLDEHRKEIDLFGLPLDIDAHAYRRGQDHDYFKLFTVRKWGRLIGYCGFWLYPYLHSKTSFHAKADVLFIKKEYRGIGLSFIKYCDQELKKLGVSHILHCVPASNDWSKVLEYLGYDKLETVYTRSV